MSRDPVGAMRARVRVVHVVETMELGGMERMIATLVRATDPKVFEVQVLCMKAVGVVGDALQRDGFPVHFARLVRGSSDMLGFLPMARTLRELRPDVVHTHNTPALLFAATGAWLAGVHHIVHTEHGRKFPDFLRYMVAERVASCVVNHVVGVSNTVTDALHRYEWIPRRKLCTIANGVEPAVRAREGQSEHLTEMLNVPTGARLVGTIGRLVWEKGLSHLLNGWPSVLSAEPTAILLVTGEGPDRAALEAQTVSLGIGDSVRFLGARTDVSAVLAVLEVFVMPSVSEGLPMALIEAMAAKVPIVATDVGGMPHALDNGDAGLVVPSADQVALATAIIRLLRNAEERSQLAAAAAFRFESHFTARAMARAYESLYLSPGRKRTPQDSVESASSAAEAKR